MKLVNNAYALIIIVFVCIVAAGSLVFVFRPRPKEGVVTIAYIGGNAYVYQNLDPYVDNVDDWATPTPELEQAALAWLREYENEIENLMPQFREDLLEMFPQDEEKIMGLTLENFGDNIAVWPCWRSIEGGTLIYCRWNFTVKMGGTPGYLVAPVAFVFVESQGLRLNKILVTKFVMPILE